MTSQTTPRVAEILAGAGDMAGEGRAGATFPALFGMIARRQMHQFGTTREQLAAVAVKNHANGAKNPLAHMRKVITLEQALAGKPIAEPLTVYDCSLISDGAAALVIVPLEHAARYSSKFARVLAVTQTSDHVALDRKADITVFPAVKAAGEKAYKIAGLGPKQIDVAELHDCFTIAEIVASEDLGFVEKGQGGPFAASGATKIGRADSDQHEWRFEGEGASGGSDGRRADLRCSDAVAGRCWRAAGGAARDRVGAELGWERGDLRGDHFRGGVMGRDGVIYTETVVHAAPEQYAADAPYQLVMVAMDGGEKVTARVVGRVKIGESVTFVEERDGVAWY